MSRERRKSKIWATKTKWIMFGKRHGFHLLGRYDIKKMNRNFYDIGLENGWLSSLCPKKTTKIWKNEKDWWAYGRERGYDRFELLSELRNRNKKWYTYGVDHGWIESARGHRFVSKEEFLKYGRKRGFNKLRPTVLIGIDNGFYQTGLKTGWIYGLTPKGTFLPWNLKWKTKKEWLRYGRKHGYHKLTRSNLRDADRTYYVAGIGDRRQERRDWLDELIEPTQRRKNTLNNVIGKNAIKTDWLEYGISQGYNRITRTDLSERDYTYYYKGLITDWLDDLIPKSIRTIKNVKQFVSQDPAVRNIIEIALLNQSYGDIAQIFTEFWPDRFPSEERLAKQLPQVIPKISHAIAPLVRYEKSFRGVYESLPVDVVSSKLEDLIYRIGTDVYQSEFNRDPVNTIKRITQIADDLSNPKAKQMAKRIANYYSDAMTFSIPGIGRVADYRGE